MKENHNPNPPIFLCHICGAEHRRKFNRDFHIKTCTPANKKENPNLYCNHCGAVFRNNYDRNWHLERCHGLELNESKPKIS